MFCHSHVNNDVITLKLIYMRDNFHEVVNNTWYIILFDHKLTKLLCIEFFWWKAFLEGSYYNYNIVFNYYYYSG